MIPPSRAAGRARRIRQRPLLPLLDRARVIEQPKLFIGYSDNTSLLSWLTCQCGLTALHGPMIEGRLAGGAGTTSARSSSWSAAGDDSSWRQKV